MHLTGRLSLQRLMTASAGSMDHEAPTLRVRTIRPKEAASEHEALRLRPRN
jgi:hypothetical protein